ncbi:MAG: hypothetical protein M1281_09625, partial [Chloroflexi bacterium]|nr:hypothetical protein [Chloroflexota bacterium]
YVGDLPPERNFVLCPKYLALIRSLPASPGNSAAAGRGNLSCLRPATGCWLPVILILIFRHFLASLRRVHPGCSQAF